jgi:hypothetical protein
LCRISRGYADTGIDPSKQVVLYDAGLGTDIGATALTAPVLAGGISRRYGLLMGSC